MGLRVIYSPDRAALGRYCLLEGVSGTAGRHGSSVDIRLQDTAVSREHLRATWIPERAAWTVEDLGSRNGVFVNGRKVQREHIVAGDVIRLGDTLLMHLPHDPALVGWTPPPDSGMVGMGAGLRAIHAQIAQVAGTDVPVLVTGETGVGKELVARGVHQQSKRSGPFVAVNCAAFTPGLAGSELFGHVRGAFSDAHRAHDGLFVSASGGTLFLDEIGELEMKVQAQLLRVVEDKAVRPVGSLHAHATDARLVAATNVDLQSAVAQGTFRRDLLARLAQWVISVPPLRDRREDIPVLVEHFVRKFANETPYSLAGDFLEALLLHSWPENVRGLSRIVRAVLIAHPGGGLLHKGLLPADLPTSTAQPKPDVSEPPPLPRLGPGASPTPSELEALLRHYEGCVADVARHLGRKRMQVYRWIERFELDPRVYRA